MEENHLGGEGRGRKGNTVGEEKRRKKARGRDFTKAIKPHCGLNVKDRNI